MSALALREGRPVRPAARPVQSAGRRIDLRHYESRLGPAFGQDASPRVNHQRMAESLAAIFMLAALCSGEHETAVLDGTRALQHMPVGFAGLAGERGGDRQE